YKKMQEVQETLPADVRLELISDNTTEIRDTINLLVESGLQGILLAMLILFLFLRSLKSTVIIGVAVPASIIITLIFMNFAGITLNMMTMTGLILGLGMVVDAAIVILENIFTYRMRGAKVKTAAMLGSKEVFISVFSGNMTTLCVFLPFIIFKKELGIMGQMFQDMIFTICIALLSSLFVAVLLVPVLAGHFLPLNNPKENPIKNPLLKKLDGFGEGIMDSITNLFTTGLNLTLKHRALTTLIVVGTLFASIVLAAFQLKVVFMPPTNEESVELNIELPLGTTLDDTRTMMYQLSGLIENDVKGYKTLILTVGSSGGFMSNDATNKGIITIQLPSAAEQIDTSETIKAKLRTYFDDFPSATFSFSQGQRGSWGGSDVDIAIRSDDLPAAMSTARDIQEILKDIEDISESSIDMTDGLPQIEVVIDRERAYSFGVSVSATANEINAAIDGTTASIYRADGKEFDIVVMYQPEDRKETTDLENIFVNGTNGRVAVANFAHIAKGLGPVDINREDQTRIIHITADALNNATPTELEKVIDAAIRANMVLPDGVSYTHEGVARETSEQANIYLLIFLLAIFLVFGVMAGTYESFKDPLINLLTIPLLIIGVILIHVLTRQSLSMTSMIGIIMLIGVVVNNGIILVDYTNLLVGRGVEVDEACLQAGISRLRPVLMSTFTTIFGMLPLCFATDGAAAMIAPIGMTVVGGLISSTFITLLFVPVVYSLMNKKRVKKIKTNQLEAQV
ncbi:MAG: efflux RND transporter permease subunit, partial [Treponemataceae bacterium]